MAAALVRETELLFAVRAGSRLPLTAGVTPPGSGVAVPRPPATSRPETIAARFEALGNQEGTGGGEIDVGRVTAALERLKIEAECRVESDADATSDDLLIATAPVARTERFWVPDGLRSLAQIDPACAGRVLVSMLCLLHRVDAAAKLVVRIKDGGTIVADSHDDHTVLTRTDSRHVRRDARPVVRSKADRLATDALGARVRWRSSREGVRLLRSLAVFPVGAEGLAAAGFTIDPLAFWRLVSASVATATTTDEWLIEHRSPVFEGAFASVLLRPGRPVMVSEHPLGQPDAVLETRPEELIRWAVGSEGGWSQRGEKRAIDALRAQIAALGMVHPPLDGLNQADG